MLIELKDGDTVIIYGDMSHSAAQEYYTNMTDALGRGLKDVKFFMGSAPQDSIVVYRASTPPAPVEDDGWFTWESAPRDGQEIDVWMSNSCGRIPTVYFEHGDFFFYDDGEKVSLIERRGGPPTHWRYPPKGPRA